MEGLSKEDQTKPVIWERSIILCLVLFLLEQLVLDSLHCSFQQLQATPVTSINTRWQAVLQYWLKRNEQVISDKENWTMMSMLFAAVTAIYAAVFVTTVSVASLNVWSVQLVHGSSFKSRDFSFRKRDTLHAFTRLWRKAGPQDVAAICFCTKKLESLPNRKPADIFLPYWRKPARFSPLRAGFF